MTSIDLHALVRTLEGRGVTLEPKPDGGVRLNAPRPLEPELLEAIRANKAALLELLTKPRPPQTLVVISSIQPTLEPRPVWQALRAAIPECLEIMGENKQVLAWIEYRSPRRGWVSTDPVSATRTPLEQLVQELAALEPDALCVAIRGAVSLHPDISPAWQGARLGVSQLARFSRREVTA